MASRVLGLVRDMLVTAVFGLSGLADAFYTAFTLPNLFRRLLGEGALTAAFVPTLSDELRARERAGAFALVNTVASWLCLTTTVLVGAAMLGIVLAARGSGAALDWGVAAETLRRWLVAADLAVVLFPYLILVCLAAVFSAALQTMQRFVEPALSPIWLNLAMIGCLGGAAHAGWADTPEGRMGWLCAGVLGGGFLQMAVPAGALMRAGWRPRPDLRLSAPLRQILRLMGPMVFGSAVYLINMAVSRFIGLSLAESTVAALNLATRLMELPIGVFAVAVSTVIFPLIARHAAAGEWDRMAADYRKGLRLILVINVPAAAGLMVLAEPIIRLLFERGAFRAADTALLAPVLAAFAVGLPFLSFVNIALRAFYAQKDTGTPVRAAILSFGVNVVLSLALMGPWGTLGLAIAGNVAVVAQAVHLQTRLARLRPGLAFAGLWADLGRIILVTALMSALVAGGWWLRTMLLGPGRWVDAVALVVLIAGGIAVYGTGLWLLRIEGREELAVLLRRARSKLG